MLCADRVQICADVVTKNTLAAKTHIRCRRLTASRPAWQPPKSIAPGRYVLNEPRPSKQNPREN